jgi:hypothetical protein
MTAQAEPGHMEHDPRDAHAGLDTEAVAKLLGLEPAPLSTADLAWMAAVVDMKGRITLKANKMRRTPQVVLHVDTKEARVARRLALLTGVAPETHEKQAVAFARRGCVEHCLEPHVHVDGPYAWRMPETTRWSVTGAGAAVVLLGLRPYMVTYGDHAPAVAMILENLVTRGQGVGMVRSALGRLKELGWAIPTEIEEKMKEGNVPE